MPTIFFSWQSDIEPAAACRSLIEGALERLAKKWSSSMAETVVVDRDTQSVPGAPNIASTIYEKIDQAALFVADLTIIARAAKRAVPNPNVMFETGYAVKSLGLDRVVLVQNKFFGPVEDLPFDLRGLRVVAFESAPDSTDRASARRMIEAALEGTQSILQSRPMPTPEVSVHLDYARDNKSNADTHIYLLSATIKNNGRRRIDDWELDIEMPTAVLTPTSYAPRVDRESNNLSTLFRFVCNQNQAWEPIRPGEKFTASIKYWITPDLFRRSREVFALPIRARCLVDGVLAAETQRAVGEMQRY